MTYLHFRPVGCLNNDRTVMSKAFAWRPLALLPILKASACAETDKDWLTERRLDLYHRSMDHIIADLNELCSKDIYLRFADNLIRLSRAFYHLLVLDGAEVAAATMCDTRQCLFVLVPTMNWTEQIKPFLIGTQKQSKHKLKQQGGNIWTTGVKSSPITYQRYLYFYMSYHYTFQ